MICVGSIISGFLNGLFASGAGQILVFMFIFFLNVETHEARATSVFIIGILTIITFIRYNIFVKLKITDVIVVTITGLAFGTVGSKIMKKIKPDYLNLISGIAITGFSFYSILKG